MEQILVFNSVSMPELTRNPSAVLEKTRPEPVAVLNHNRPVAYILPAHVYEAMLNRLNADLRMAIQDGVDSGPAVAAEDVFAELNDRYAEPRRGATTKARAKRST